MMVTLALAGGTPDSAAQLVTVFVVVAVVVMVLIEFEGAMVDVVFE